MQIRFPHTRYPLRTPVVHTGHYLFISPDLPSLLKTIVHSIPKKFKWAGEVFMHTEKDRAEKLFEGTLSEEPPKQTKTLRFSYCMGEKVDSLRLMKLLHVSELPMLQAACSQVSQLGRLEPKEDKDHDAFGTLIKYMTPRQLVCFSASLTIPCVIDPMSSHSGNLRAIVPRGWFTMWNASPLSFRLRGPLRYFQTFSRSQTA